MGLNMNLWKKWANRYQFYLTIYPLNRQNTWDHDFQDIGYQVVKKNDWWEVGSKQNECLFAKVNCFEKNPSHKQGGETQTEAVRTHNVKICTVWYHFYVDSKKSNLQEQNTEWLLPGTQGRRGGGKVGDLGSCLSKGVNLQLEDEYILWKHIIVITINSKCYHHKTEMTIMLHESSVS